ncbi:hypothetical protein CK820_G0051723 [Pan troglodytes]|uniref:Uncharacterized protein n=2 Tax=Pan troglodytes TaxID=9598 RepID=A0A2J8IZT9_PANTR|nr:hypothetical protein CK820_G0051723 [Pan troglodytes]
MTSCWEMVIRHKAMDVAVGGGTEERLREDTARKWLSASQEERPPQKPTLLAYPTSQKTQGELLASRTLRKCLLDLSATLLCKLEPGQSEIAEELCQRLQRKERMLQDLLSDRNKQVVEHEMEIQGLLRSMSTREQESQGSMQIPSRDDSTSSTAKEDASIPRSTLGELDTVKGLVEKELSTAKEELELMAKKERESQMELSALQSMMAVQEEEPQVQAADMESLTRNIQIKEDLIKVFQNFLKTIGNVHSSEYL